MSTESGSPRIGSGVVFRMFRVLCVDSSAVELDSLRLAFERYGCHVETASSVTTARSALNEYAIDFICTDWNLGDDMRLDWLAHLDPVPMVVVTGDSIPGGALPPFVLGFFRKPTDPGQLASFAMGRMREQEALSEEAEG